MSSSSDDDDIYSEIKQSLIGQLQSIKYSDEEEDQDCPVTKKKKDKKKTDLNSSSSIPAKKQKRTPAKEQKRTPAKEQKQTPAEEKQRQLDQKKKKKKKSKAKKASNNKESNELQDEQLSHVDTHFFGSDDWEGQSCDEYSDVSEKLIPEQSKIVNKRIEEFKLKLGITNDDIARSKQQNESEQKRKAKAINMTTPSFQAQRKRPPPEIVVFEDPAKRKSKRASTLKRSKQPSDDASDEDDGFDLKQAHYEVRKLGIEAMEPKSKEEAKLALLMSLGAKAPKNKCLNYVEFQVQKKQERDNEIKKQQLLRNLGFKVKTSTKKSRKKRNINDVGYLDGQVGQYKHGVTVISKAKIDGKL